MINGLRMKAAESSMYLEVKFIQSLLGKFVAMLATQVLLLGVDDPSRCTAPDALMVWFESFWAGLASVGALMNNDVPS